MARHAFGVPGVEVPRPHLSGTVPLSRLCAIAMVCPRCLLGSNAVLFEPAKKSRAPK
jgi:hypothetical protein